MRKGSVLLVLKYLIIAAMLFIARPVYADCSDPVAPEGHITYNTTYKTMQFCDGDKWWSMNGGAGSGIKKNIAIGSTCNLSDSIAISPNDVLLICDTENLLWDRAYPLHPPGSGVYDSDGTTFLGVLVDKDTSPGSNPSTCGKLEIKTMLGSSIFYDGQCYSQLNGRTPNGTFAWNSSNCSGAPIGVSGTGWSSGIKLYQAGTNNCFATTGSSPGCPGVQSFGLSSSDCINPSNHTHCITGVNPASGCNPGTTQWYHRSKWNCPSGDCVIQ